MKSIALLVALPALAAVLTLPTGCATSVEIPVIAAPDHSVFAPATAATNQLGLDLYRQLAAAKPGENLLLSPYSKIPVIAAPDHSVFAPATAATNQLGLDLYRQLAAAQPGENLLLSPYSIQSALAMTYAGADGDTRAEMAKVLHYPVDDATLAASFAAIRAALDDAASKAAQAAKEDLKERGGELTMLRVEIQALKTAGKAIPPSFEIELQGLAQEVKDLDLHPTEFHTANRLYAQIGFEFRAPFLALLRDGYQAPLEQLDFKTAAEPARIKINAWVEDQTRQKIRDLIPPNGLGHDTRLVLVNAFYLKVPWHATFSNQDTESLPFRLRDKSSVIVPTMHKALDYGYEKFRGFSAITLPYADESLQFLILLPDDPAGVDTLPAMVTPELLRACTNLTRPDWGVDLYLPKFRFEAPTIKLSGMLQALGLKTPFDHPTSSANFDRMAPRRPDDNLCLAEVFQKSCFTLDEKGTEAVADVSVQVGLDSLVPGPTPPPRVVHVDHPFLFAIQHRESGACLFLGRVTDPR